MDGIFRRVTQICKQEIRTYWGKIKVNPILADQRTQEIVIVTVH